MNLRELAAAFGPPGSSVAPASVAAMRVFAYLDPGTGSVIVQLLVGGLAAAGVALKLYWGRLLRMLRIRREDPDLSPRARPQRLMSPQGADVATEASVRVV